MIWDADKYDSAGSAPQADAGRDLIGLAGIKRADTILDLGCGTGKLTLELARMTPEGSVTGLDPSDEMLQKAMDVSTLVPNLSFKKGPAQEMDFEAAFELVFSNSALHWGKKQRQAIERTYRALKPGGRIAFQMPAEGFFPELLEYAGEAIKTTGFERFFKDFSLPWCFPSKKEYACMLKDAGFLKVRVFYRDYHLVFGSINRVLDYCASSVLRPHLSMLPEKEREYFEYAFAMQFENGRTGRGIECNFRRLFAFAVRPSFSRRR